MRTVRQHLEHVGEWCIETDMIAILTQAGLIQKARPNTLMNYLRTTSTCRLRGLCCPSRPYSADEPTSMLDVSLRSDILQLLRDLQVHHQMALLLITHDMAVAKALTEEIIVLEKGVVVESGNTLEVFSNPQHSYTQQLLRASHSLEAS